MINTINVSVTVNSQSTFTVIYSASDFFALYRPHNITPCHTKKYDKGVNASNVTPDCPQQLLRVQSLHGWAAHIQKQCKPQSPEQHTPVRCYERRVCTTSRMGEILKCGRQSIQLSFLKYSRLFPIWYFSFETSVKRLSGESRIGRVISSSSSIYRQARPVLARKVFHGGSRIFASLRFIFGNRLINTQKPQLFCGFSYLVERLQASAA